MDPPAQQYPDAAQRIMTLMKETFGTSGEVFNAYYLGIPDNVSVIPEAAYPVMIVQKAVGEFHVGPTMADDISENVYIHIKLSTKPDTNSPPDDDTTMRRLQTLVEGRDPTTGYFLPISVMYALRTNLTLDSDSVPGIVTINNDINVSYDAQDTSQPNTREAVIDIAVTERQIVLNRR